MAVKSSSLPLPLIVAAVAVIAVTLAYTFFSSGRGGGGGGGGCGDGDNGDDDDDDPSATTQKDRSESDATPRTQNTAPNESSLSLVALEASASEKEAAHLELTFEEEILEEATTATTMEKSEVAKARALEQFPGSIKAPLSESSQGEVTAGAVASEEEVTAAVATIVAAVHDTFSPSTSEHKRKTEPSSPMKPKHKEFRPELTNPASVPATPTQDDGDESGGLLEHKRKSATSPTKPKHKEFRSTPNPGQEDDDALGFGDKEFRPKLDILSATPTLPDDDQDEGEHEPKSAVSPTKPKSKKIRPKLTPDSTQDVEEEGDLGFGDIVATSTAQSTTTTEAPSKSSRATISSSASVPKPTKDSASPKAARRSTTTKLIKLDDSDEDIETPGEGADYSKISSYWKFKENKNEFVPLKSKTSVSYSGSGGPPRSKDVTEEEGGGWERAMSRKLQAVEKEAEEEETRKVLAEEEEGGLEKSEEDVQELLQETTTEKEVPSVAAEEATASATIAEATFVKWERAMSRKLQEAHDEKEAEEGLGKVLAEEEEGVGKKDIRELQETVIVEEASSVAAVETTETAIEEAGFAKSEETQELQETTIGEEVSSVAAVETTETANEEEATTEAAAEVVTNEETEELQETTNEEELFSVAAVQTTTAATEWKKEIFASVVNVEQVQSQKAIYGNVIDAEATRATNLDEQNAAAKADVKEVTEVQEADTMPPSSASDIAEEVVIAPETTVEAEPNSGEEAESKPEIPSKPNGNDNNSDENEPNESDDSNDDDNEPKESDDDDNNSDTYDPQLIVPSGSDESSGSSKGSSHDYVKIRRTSTGDAMTESEFLSRPIIDIAADDVEEEEKGVTTTTSTTVPAVETMDAPPADTSGELSSPSQETATFDDTAEVVLKDDEIKEEVGAVIAGNEEAGGDAEGIVVAEAAEKTTVDNTDDDEAGGDAEGIVVAEAATAIADDSNVEEAAETDAADTTTNTTNKKKTNKKKKKKKGKKK